MSGPRFWRRWVFANTAGELVGLGAAALAGYGVVAGFGEPAGAAVLPFAVVMLAVGTFEGAVIGVAQWWVLRSALPDLAARRWIAATALGAFTAWLLGMIPSTIVQLIGVENGGGPPELTRGEVTAAAAGLGALLGVVLAVPQWWVLRRVLPRAHWWLPANALAWAAGMPVVFAAAGGMPESASVTVIVLSVLGTIALAGAIVGAVHGAVLVRLLRAVQARRR